MLSQSEIYQTAILPVLVTALMCISYLVFNFIYLRKKRLQATFILTLPSTIIPTIIFIGYCSSIIWSLFDEQFKISFLRLDYLAQTSLLISGFAFTILIGMLMGRQRTIRRLQPSFFDRSLDKLLYGENGYYFTIFLILIAIFVFPFCFALEIDLILKGSIRRLVVTNELLFYLIPFARILLSIFTIVSGILIAYKNSKLLFIVPLLEITQHLMKLSRGFFIPVILFLFSYNLSGKKVPVWLYFLTLFLSIVAGAAAIAARGSGGQGIIGLSVGVTDLDSDLFGSMRDFFEVNAVIGILSTAVSLRSPYSSSIDGFFTWLQSILPIPSFVGVSGGHLSIAKLLNITHAGIPMPALGELYFYMGWWSLIIFLLFGIYLGKTEGNMIAHVLIHKRSYWTHILIWLSMLFGFILCMHSPSRSATRLLMYSIIFTSLLNFVLNLNKNK
jgi:hypothetical protein